MLSFDPIRFFREIASNPHTNAALLAAREVGLGAFIQQHSKTIRTHFAQAGHDLAVDETHAAATALWWSIQACQRFWSGGGASPPLATPTTQNLRQRAEARLHAKDVSGGGAFTREDMEQLVHELLVHQIELELQNEELRRTQQTLECSQARYFSLYDLAPAGYVTLNPEGLIQEVNLAAADLLETPRGQLIDQPLTR